MDSSYSEQTSIQVTIIDSDEEDCEPRRVLRQRDEEMVDYADVSDEYSVEDDDDSFVEVTPRGQKKQKGISIYTPVCVRLIVNRGESCRCGS